MKSSVDCSRSDVLVRIVVRSFDWETADGIPVRFVSFIELAAVDSL